MKNVVITGSTRGIGFGLAEAFLAKGCKVLVSGRSEGSVKKAIDELTKLYPEATIGGAPCDVSNLEDVQNLWTRSKEFLGTVDIWINNAGIGHPPVAIWDLSAEQTKAVVDVDLMGVIYGSQVAMNGMSQQGTGHIYNMEGFGSDGKTQFGMGVYGAAKSAVRYFTKALTKEAKDTPVKVGTLSPGIVITDFLTTMYKDEPERFEKAKPIFNILGDEASTVTPWLAGKVLSNDASGKSFAWLTPQKAMMRFMTAGFNKRDFFQN